MSKAGAQAPCIGWVLERMFLISIKAFLEFSIRGALARPFSCRSANARPYSSLAPQYEPHTELRPFNMMRRRPDPTPPSFLHQSLFTTIFLYFGCIAQLVEHWAFNLMVAGSSPAIPKQTYLTLYLLIRMRSNVQRSLFGL